MKKSFILLLVIIAIFQIRTTSANNIRLEGVVKVTKVNGNIATLEFPLKWDNAWRDSYNWDAIWLFLKYKKAGGEWIPVNLEETGHALTANDGKTYTCLLGKTDDKTVGLFILLNEPTTCNPSLTCRLKWKLPEGLTQETFENNNAFILAQGIEMVYVPYGAYQLGEESTPEAFSPGIMDNEEAREMTTNANSSEKIALTAGYPKGYQGFHIMKYETSQEQYVTFLNTLTLVQQQELVPKSATLKAGDYIFGRPEQPDYRNGIILAQRPEGKPMIFENNLTPGEEYGQENDGKYLPCNYMTVKAMAAYCAWAGLRPSTELEFEKTCRRPLPDLPTEQEYIWGGKNTPLYAQAINSENTPREKPGNGQVNAGGYLNGPLRCGSFAAASPGQQSSGATYWGIMELAGNLREIYATVKNTTISSTLHGTGEYATSLWGTDPQAFGYRGGSFMSPKEALRTTDRSETDVITDLNKPDSTAGFRGVRTFAAGAGMSIQAGSIELAGGGTTVCPGEDVVVNNTASASVTGMDNLPINYLWYVDGVTLTETGETLKLTDLTNTGTAPESHTIKRKAICMLGEAETNEITISVLPIPDFTLNKTTASIGINGTATAVTATASVTGVTLNFNWIYQGTTIATGKTYTPATSHFGNTPGTYYTVICEASSGDCSSAPIKKEITVKYVIQTAGAIALADGITNICPEGKTITIDNKASATVSSGEIITYSWKVNGTILSGQNQETLTYTIPQNSGNSAVTYEFIRIATTSEGSKESPTLTVSAKPWPNFTLSAASVLFITPLTPPQITATSSSGTTLSYVWKYNSNTVSSANIYTPLVSTLGSKEGSYTVTCTSSISGCNATANQKLTITLSTCGGNFIDPRDNKVYPMILAGDQCWMAKNLNVGTFTPIICGGGNSNTNSYTFDKAGIQKWCIGGTGSNIRTDNEVNCNTYGGLYEWWEVICGGYCNGKMTPVQAMNMVLNDEYQLIPYGAKMVPGSFSQVRGICPDGWHLPSNAEWATLSKAVTGWNLIWGGCRAENGHGFYDLNRIGYYWSSTPNSSGAAWRSYLFSSATIGTPFSRDTYPRSYGYGVRCIRN